MDDLIGRQAAILHLKKRLIETAINNTGVTALCDSIFADTADNRIETWIMEIPSAHLERKPGRWIRDSVYTEDVPFVNPIICSECRSVATVDLYGEYNQSCYCPNCGAKMEVDNGQADH